MEIYKKLLDAKKEIGKISKDKNNPFFDSKYFDVNQVLEHVEPILQKNNLLLLQPISAEWVKTEIIDVETGEKIDSEIHLQSNQDPQKLGSAITYYRRYTLTSLLGLQADDDDGNLASKPTSKKQDNTPVEWMTESQFKKVISSDADTIKQSLNWYDGKTVRDGKKYVMKKQYKAELQSKLS